MLAGHGAELSTSREDDVRRRRRDRCGEGRRRRGRDELDGWAGLGDGGEIEDGGGSGDDRRVDRKVEDEQNILAARQSN